MAISHGAKLGQKKQEAIEALLLPGSVEDAARRVEVTPKKLHLWMKDDPVFAAVYRTAKGVEYRQAIASLATNRLSS